MVVKTRRIRIKLAPDKRRTQTEPDTGPKGMVSAVSASVRLPPLFTYAQSPTGSIASLLKTSGIFQSGTISRDSSTHGPPSAVNGQ